MIKWHEGFQWLKIIIGVLGMVGMGTIILELWQIIHLLSR
jgi:hypothetical protein